MSKNITQKVVFKNTTPKALYELYMNARKHALVTGAPASITSKVGAKFSAHNGYITGENVYLRKDALIVQTWRGMDWDKKDPDSIFMIELEPKGKDTILHAVHANVPDKQADGVDKGWHSHYWERWKKYLAGKPLGEYPKM